MFSIIPSLFLINQAEKRRSAAAVRSVFELRPVQAIRLRHRLPRAFPLVLKRGPSLLPRIFMRACSMNRLRYPCGKVHNTKNT